MPYRAIAKEALDRWREAHRRLEAADADSPAWQQASKDEALARQAYQDAIDAARRQHLPEPPPFSQAAADDETKTDMGAEGEDGQVYGG